MPPRSLLFVALVLLPVAAHAEPVADAPHPDAPAASGNPLPWVDEVRNQRRALQEWRRAQHGAQQDARYEGFLRRRHERRELMEQERQQFRNYGPWREPLGPTPVPANPTTAPQPPTPPGWDNGWYYNGW